MKRIVLGGFLSMLLVACSAAYDGTESTADEQGAEETGDLDEELSGGVETGTKLRTIANLNFRTGPSLDDHVMLVIPDGAEVVTVNRTTPANGFYNIRYAGKEGWSYGAYLVREASLGGGGGGDTNAVSRALQWVQAGVPYCGGVNGGHDYICGGTCNRPHNQWDNYRSDCSGLVSFAWGLPAPGHTTSGFAPFDNSVSHTIPGSELQSGDAINNSHHVMLFWHWVNKSQGTATFIEESDCGLKALTRTFSIWTSGNQVHLGNDTYYAIRH